MSVHGTTGPTERADPSGQQAPERPAVLRAGRWQERLDAVAARVPQRRRLPLVVYAACQVIFLFWWTAFYPGLFSYDSVTYLIHVTTGPWVANHSVLYDSLVWLSLHATGGLAALTLAQTAAMSAALAYTVVAFRRLGVPGRWTAVAAIVVAALPPTGTFVVFVWKDVAFSICAYLVVPTLAHLLSLRASAGWRGGRQVNRLIAALGLEMLGMCLFRLNGFLVVVIAGVALVLLLPGVRARLAAAAAAAVCLAFTLNLAVYPAVGIQKAPAALALAPAYSDIAVAYAERPSSFTTADRALMARVAPLAEWSATANCLSADATDRIPGFNAKVGMVSGQLFSLWLRVFARSPDLVLSARICRGSVAWSIFSSAAAGNPGYLSTSVIPSSLFGLAAAKDVRDNPYRAALATRPWLRPLNKLAVFTRAVVQVPQLQWLLWRGATWCYLAYLAVWTFARRRHDRALFSLAAIVAGQQLAIIIDNPSQVFRYMASPILIGMMLVPLFFARTRTAAETGTAAEESPGPAEAQSRGRTGDGLLRSAAPRIRTPRPRACHGGWESRRRIWQLPGRALPRPDGRGGAGLCQPSDDCRARRDLRPCELPRSPPTLTVTTWHDALLPETDMIHRFRTTAPLTIAAVTSLVIVGCGGTGTSTPAKSVPAGMLADLAWMPVFSSTLISTVPGGGFRYRRHTAPARIQKAGSSARRPRAPYPTHDCGVRLTALQLSATVQMR